ncbi:DUF924 family protein [soil metagenome]
MTGHAAVERRVSVDTADAGEPGWVEHVLAFWFGTLPPADWFVKHAALDEAIGKQFLPVHATLSAQSPAASSARVALAAVVVLDQFSRNLFRGDPRAFASDAAARAIASSAIDARWDLQMSAAERLFLYMPFEHSESLIDQDRAVALVQTLGNDDWAHFARMHQQIIARFGRFPHRNAALGRVSTEAELAFLSEPDSGF